jgi:hypothetical protein
VKALTKDPCVSQPIGKKGFGRTALYSRGRIFAFLTNRKQLGLKLEPERVRDLVESGAGMYWDPTRSDRVYKNWVILNPSSVKGWFPLAKQALKIAKKTSVPPKLTRN